MNYLLHRQRSPGSVVPIPEGLEDLMAEISRAVLRAQPPDVIGFVADFLEEKLVHRENRRLAEKVVDNVLDYSLDIVAMLERAGIDRERAEAAMKRIREEFHRHFETKTDDERLREAFRERAVLERLVKECRFSESEARKASAIIEQAYRTFYFRNAYKGPHPPAQDMDWRQAAKHSLSIYAQCGPTQEEMELAARRIQMAYRGYYTRKRELLDRQATVIQRAFRSHQDRNRQVVVDGSPIHGREELRHEKPSESESSFSANEEIMCLIKGVIGDEGEERSDLVKEHTEHKGSSEMHLNEAATLIQSVFRGHRRRRQDATVPDGANEAATLLQSTVRGHLTRKKWQHATAVKEHQMATLLQSHARGYLARRRHSRNHPDNGSPTSSAQRP